MSTIRNGMPYSHTTFDAWFSIAVETGDGTELLGLDAKVAVLRLYNSNGLVEHGASFLLPELTGSYISAQWRLLYTTATHPSITIQSQFTSIMVG